MTLNIGTKFSHTGISRFQNTSTILYTLVSKQAFSFSNQFIFMFTQIKSKTFNNCWNKILKDVTTVYI